jgi:hypothetical protein
MVGGTSPELAAVSLGFIFIRMSLGIGFSTAHLWQLKQMVAKH